MLLPVLGAGPSIAYYARAFDNLFKGNIEESKRELRRIIPFMAYLILTLLVII